MLAFIIPLKSSQVSGSWDLVCKLFERTLKSVCNQTSSEFMVIVVCHEKPDIAFTHPQVTYVEVDLPLPGAEYASKEKDKMCKMLAGLIQADKMNASHVMFVDADDCVSKHLAEYVSKNIEGNGWFIDKGYEYREDVGRLKARRKNFHLRTNSSHIIKTSLLEPDMNVSFSDVKRENSILYHIDTAKILKERGTPLESLPFKGVVYITDNGENMWWSQANISTWVKNFGVKEFFKFHAGKLYQLLITRSITSSIKDEFSI